MKLQIHSTTITVCCIIILTTLFPIRGQGQPVFTNASYIDVMEKLAGDPKQKAVKKHMKKEGYDAPRVETNNLGGENMVFDKAYFPSIGLFYTKDERLVVITGFCSPQKLYMAEADLKKTSFKIISSKTEKNQHGIDVIITHWAKKGYPYQFIVNHIDDIIDLVMPISNQYIDNF